ncbi:MAG TPA: YhjD/YihY/BrkB family envelope integrity protein [Anaeromyxobacteraceae bacterium]|nr:YhjD/YihY/BrkB family envelope integrity protein [Anaeromyxobacteraceae bacterium]
MMVVWAAVYYLLPDVAQTIRSILPGAVVGVLVWLVATIGFSFYVAHFGNFGVAYGALGGARRPAPLDVVVVAGIDAGRGDQRGHPEVTAVTGRRPRAHRASRRGLQGTARASGYRTSVSG